MAIKDWLIGTLVPDGYLKTESGKILLTTLPKGALQPSEAAHLHDLPRNLQSKARHARHLRQFDGLPPRIFLRFSDNRATLDISKL